MKVFLNKISFNFFDSLRYNVNYFLLRTEEKKTKTQRKKKIPFYLKHRLLFYFILDFLKKERKEQTYSFQIYFFYREKVSNKNETFF